MSRRKRAKRLLHDYAQVRIYINTRMRSIVFSLPDLITNRNQVLGVSDTDPLVVANLVSEDSVYPCFERRLSAKLSAPEPHSCSDQYFLDHVLGIAKSPVPTDQQQL